MKNTIILAAVVMTGCATSKEVNMPDGSIGYKVSCDASALNFGECDEKARNICGSKGYVILNKDGDRDIFIKCKE